jgi:hypothetical protein
MIFLAGNSDSFEIIFPAMNLKKNKDDYSGKFAEILKNVQSGNNAYRESMQPELFFFRPLYFFIQKTKIQFFSYSNRQRFLKFL